MKRIIVFGIMILSIMSCVKETVSEPEFGQQTLTANVENNIVTKVGFTRGDAEFFWTKGDKIGVTTSTSQKNFSLMTLDESNAGKASGTFNGNMGGTPKGYAVYPYISDAHQMSETTLTYHLPSEYSYSNLDETYADSEGNSHNAPMYGKIVNGSVSFKHLGGVIAFEVNGLPANTKDLSFVLTASNKICGDFSVDLSADTPELVSGESGDSNDKRVFVSFSTSEEQTSGYIYIPVPTGYIGDLKVEVWQSKTELMTAYWDDIKIARKDIRIAKIGTQHIEGEGGEATTVGTASEVTDAMEKATDITVEEVAGDEGSETDATIEIPKKEDNTEVHTLTINAIDESIETIHVRENSEDTGNSIENLVINVPTTEAAKSLFIEMPNSTVTIAVNGEKYLHIEEVSASTAENTFIIDKNVTIGHLDILKGNVRVKAGAGVKTWSSKSSVRGTIYIEEKASAPDEAPDGYKIVKEYESTSLSDFLANNTTGTYYLTSDEILYTTNTVIPEGVTIDGGEEKYSVYVKCEADEGTGKGVFVLKGGTIRNVTFTSACTQYDIIVEAGSTIEGCNFTTPTVAAMGKGKRALFSNSESVSGDLYVSDCKFNDQVYAFNFSKANNLNIIFSNCLMNGWLSGHGAFHHFENCEFGKSGDYQNYIPYCDATFVNCIFYKGFTISLKHASDLTFNENCYVGSTLITSPKDLTWDFSGDGQDNGTSEKVTIGSDSWYNSTTGDEDVEWNEVVAEIKNKGCYSSLGEALQAVEQYEIIYILKDINDATGLVIDTKLDPICIDFQGHTYTLNKPGVGSTGTTTLGFQILEGQNVTFRNGTINCSDANKDCTWSSGDTEKGIAMMLQNYANLTLENMTIDGTNIAHNGDNVRYIVSNNSGNVNFTENTSIIAPEGDIAFDVCKYASYNTPQVVWASEGQVIGGIELTGGGLLIEKDLELTKPIKAVKNSTGIQVNGNIRPSASWNGGDALVVVKRNTDLHLSGSGSIDAGDNANIYAAVKMTEKGEENTEGTAKLSVYDLTLKGYYYGITGNGNRHDTHIIIGSGIIGHNCPNDGHAIYHPQDGILEVWGGELTGYNSAVELRAGKMTVNVGAGQENIVPTFTSLYTDVSTEENGNGTSIKGAAIAVSQHSTHKPIELQILGGVFNGNYALYEAYTYNDDGFVKDGSWFEIHGRLNNGVIISGTFNGKVYSENMGEFINFGTFKDESALEYIVKAAESTKNSDGTWSVKTSNPYQ